MMKNVYLLIFVMIFTLSCSQNIDFNVEAIAAKNTQNNNNSNDVDNKNKSYRLNVVGGSGSGTYEVGTRVYIQAEKKSGNQFNSWLTEDNLLRIDLDLEKQVIVMPARDVVVRANYTAGLASFSRNENFDDIVEAELMDLETGMYNISVALKNDEQLNAPILSLNGQLIEYGFVEFNPVNSSYLLTYQVQINKNKVLIRLKGDAVESFSIVKK